MIYLFINLGTVNEQRFNFTDTVVHTFEQVERLQNPSWTLWDEDHWAGFQGLEDKYRMKGEHQKTLIEMLIGATMSFEMTLLV